MNRGRPDGCFRSPPWKKSRAWLAELDLPADEMAAAAGYARTATKSAPPINVSFMKRRFELYVGLVSTIPNSKPPRST